MLKLKDFARECSAERAQLVEERDALRGKALELMRHCKETTERCSSKESQLEACRVALEQSEAENRRLREETALGAQLEEQCRSALQELSVAERAAQELQACHEKELSSRDSEVAALRQRLEESESSDEELRRVREELSSAQRTLQELESAQSSRESEVAALRQRLEESESSDEELRRVREELSSAHRAIQELRFNHEQREDSIAELKGNLHRAVDKLKTLNVELQALREHSSSVERREAALVEELNGAMATVKLHSEANSKLEACQNALAAELEKVSSLEMERNALHSALTEVNEVLIKKDGEIAMIKSNLSEEIHRIKKVADSDVEELQTKLQAVEAELVQVREEKSGMEVSNAAANEKLSKAVEKLRSLVATYEAKAEECSALEAEVTGLKPRISELMDAVAERDAQLRYHEEKMERMRELEAHALAEEQLRAEVRRLNDEYAGSQDAFEKYRIRAKKSLSEMSVAQRELEDRLAQRDRVADTLSERVKELERRLKTSEESTAATVEEYKGYMARDRAQIEELRGLLSSAEERLSSVHLLIREDYKAEETNLRDELEGLRSRNITLQQSLQAAEAKLLDATERENGLLAEMRKRGDLARQILLKKEEEIKALSSKSEASSRLSNKTEQKVSLQPSMSGRSMREAALWDEKSKYLKKAFAGFVSAEGLVQMQSLGRVICAILDMDAAEQAAVMEAIGKICPENSSPFESLSSLIMGSPAKR